MERVITINTKWNVGDSFYYISDSIHYGTIIGIEIRAQGGILDKWNLRSTESVKSFSKKEVLPRTIRYHVLNETDSVDYLNDNNVEKQVIDLNKTTLEEAFNSLTGYDF